MARTPRARARRPRAWTRLIPVLLLGALALFGALRRPLELGLDLRGGTDVVYRVDSTRPGDVEAAAVVLRRRLEMDRVPGAVVRPQADDQLRVQVPCEEEERCREIRRLLERTELLTMHEVLGAAPSPVSLFAGDDDLVLPLGAPAGGSEASTWFRLRREPDLTGSALREVRIGFEPVTGGPTVELLTTSTGRDVLRRLSARLRGRSVAVVLGEEVITAAVMEQEIPDGHAVLRGSFDVEEARRLVGLLGAGALPAPLVRLSSSSVGPTLGAESIAAGWRACAGGIGLVGVYMALYYRWAGVFADLGLALNLALQVACLQVLGISLTLPGVAGVILTVGMSVDANVICFERVKEELERGRSPPAAIRTGFGRALSAVLDSNVTTLLTALVLYLFGSGPVRGFAVTLGVGLVCSLVSALWAVRVMLEVAHAGARSGEEMSIG